MNNKKKFISKKLIAFVCVAFVFVVAFVLIVFFINKGNEKTSIKGTNNEETTTESAYYTGIILSANENWIGSYEVGSITECVYNNDRTGIIENNESYKCSDGVSCCTGDMEAEFNYNGGSALGGAMPESDVME